MTVPLRVLLAESISANKWLRRHPRVWGRAAAAILMAEFRSHPENGVRDGEVGVRRGGADCAA